MKLHDLAPPDGSHRSRRRVGRGIAGKGGKTAGRGTKGQKARTQIPARFEGGQQPILARAPKLRGFTNPFRVSYTPVNLDHLDALGVDVVDLDVLVAHGLARKGAMVKVLVARCDRASGAGERPRVLQGRGVGDRGRRRDDRDHRPAVRPRPPAGARQPAHEPLTAMLARLANIFRVPDLRNKVAFTLGIIALYQLGANVPIPGASFARIQDLEAEAGKANALGFLNLFSGGALAKLAIFGLGVMPYITSSIIIQLLTSVIPKLTEWREQGAVGQKRSPRRPGTSRWRSRCCRARARLRVPRPRPGTHRRRRSTSSPSSRCRSGLFMVLCMTAGTAFVMWLAELITQRGVGQGMSILIFSNVVAGIPRASSGHLRGGRLGEVRRPDPGLVHALGLHHLRGPRTAPHPGHVRPTDGRTQDDHGPVTYIPFKVNQSGVVPIIFASSMLYIPVLLSNVIPWTGFQNLVQQPRRNPTTRPTSSRTSS